MTEKHFDSLGLTLKEYHDLPSEEQLELNKDYCYNPFDPRIKRNELPMMNAFTFDISGPWEDGGHYTPNPFNFIFHRKMKIRNNNVVKAWDITDDYELVEIPYHEIKGYTLDGWNNDLTDEKRRELLHPTMVNPFEIPEGFPLMNPFTFEVKNGPLEDGDSVSYHIMTGRAWKRMIVEGGEVIKAFNYNLEKREWIEIPKPWGAGEGENH
jgi:hypothetical protein